MRTDSHTLPAGTEAAPWYVLCARTQASKQARKTDCCTPLIHDSLPEPRLGHAYLLAPPMNPLITDHSPICLTPLFFDAQDHNSGDMSGEKQELSSFADAQADLEAGIPLPARPPHAVLRGDPATTSTSTSTSPSSATETLPSGTAAATTDSAEGAARPAVVVVDSADVVLTLRSCRHTFHKRCLASWCLRWRYDCPVCREPYYCDASVGVVSYI